MFTIKKSRPAEAQTLDCLNWPEQFPYKPSVQFRIWHDGSNIHIEYTVDEKTVRALEGKDGEYVYKDSCVEFFFQPRPDDSHYYNFEFNAIGTLDLSWRTGRNDPEDAPAEVLAMVKKVSSLGTEPFAERDSRGPWTLKVSIPAEALWHSGIDSFDGLQARANLYKCGDALATPHYVTWAPIQTPGPDYHRPEFFAPVIFE